MKAKVPISLVHRRWNPSKRNTRDVDVETHDGPMRFTVTKEIAKRGYFVGWVISKSIHWAVVEISTISSGPIRLSFRTSSIELNVSDAAD